MPRLDQRGKAGHGKIRRAHEDETERGHRIKSQFCFWAGQAVAFCIFWTFFSRMFRFSIDR
jgi:hypothetical protein